MQLPKIIRPELVATKLKSIRNHESPEILQQLQECLRIPELLMWLQWMSMQPGGLVELARQMVDAKPGRFATATMRKGKPASLDSLIAVYNEIPGYAKGGNDTDEDRWSLDVLLDCPNGQRGLNKSERSAAWTAVRSLLGSDPDAFPRICKERARAELPEFLYRLCTEPGYWFPRRGLWYFADPLQGLLEFMDMHAEQQRGTIALNSISKTIFEAMERARETNALIQLRGDPRTGKTDGMKCHCRMWPGRERFVRMPSTGSMRDFIFAIAEALGIDVTYGSSLSVIRSKVRFVLEHTGVFPVFDEAHYLLPRRTSRGDFPDRLDWVREIYDGGTPVVMGVTPQWFDPALSTFVKRSGYVIEQFTGRCEVLTLPEVSKEDVVKVAAVHFPEITARVDLLRISKWALRTPNHLQAIGDIEKRARYQAKRSARPLSMGIIQEAINSMFSEASGCLIRDLNADLNEAPGSASNRLLNGGNMRRVGSEGKSTELVLADS